MVKSDYFIVISEDTKKKLLNWIKKINLINQVKIIVLHPLPSFNELVIKNFIFYSQKINEKKNIKSNQLNIICTSGNSPSKRKEILLPIFEKLASRNPDKIINISVFGAELNLENIQSIKILNMKFNQGHARCIATGLKHIFEKEEFDICTIFYNQFKNVITQIPQAQQIIPLNTKRDDQNDSEDNYEFEPDEDEILSNLLPKNISTQIFKAMLENSASEQGARMSAMDNATRNAGEMVDKLTIEYNRSRQAAITKELIEIISGAESL